MLYGMKKIDEIVFFHKEKMGFMNRCDINNGQAIPELQSGGVFRIEISVLICCGFWLCSM